MTPGTLFINLPLGDYCPIAFLGSGAFSLVYEAMHVPSGAHVALKILKPGASLDENREFENEGQLLVKLSGSSGVVNLLDTTSAQVSVTLAATGQNVLLNTRFHVLELANACLVELLAHRGRLPWSERLELYRGVALGVHQMHCKHVMHRDLKTANCLLFERPGHDVAAKVADLGRSRDLTQLPGASPWQYIVGRGDPNFAPPETLWQLGQDQAASHRQVDLYGLGSLFFELATGIGLTGIALLPKWSVIAGDLALPTDRRRLLYASRAHEIRGWFETAYALLGKELPPSIRAYSTGLVRHMCDPVPERRMPVVGPGRHATSTHDLNWLLRSIDILRKTLHNAEAQAAMHANRQARA